MSRIPEDLQKELAAAKNMDWMQTRLNGAYGPPCFHLEEGGTFCGRAQGWHDKTTDKLFHKFTPLHTFVERIASLTERLATATAERDAAGEKAQHTQEWYAHRWERLMKWARTEIPDQLRDQFFSILTNGTKDSFEPPTYAQQFNILKGRMEIAEAENTRLREQLARASAPVSDEDAELRVLKVKDALLWLEESSLNMRRKLDAQKEPEIARQSDITALYIKSLLEDALLAARAERKEKQQ